MIRHVEAFDYSAHKYTSDGDICAILRDTFKFGEFKNEGCRPFATGGGAWTVIDDIRMLPLKL